MSSSLQRATVNQSSTALELESDSAVTGVVRPSGSIDTVRAIVLLEFLVCAEHIQSEKQLGRAAHGTPWCIYAARER